MDELTTKKTDAKSQTSYKKGMKGIAIFGGLQIYKIALSVLTTKVSAVFLGPVGTGIYGLISSILMSVESVVCCGLGTSSVKDIAEAKARDDEESLAKTYAVLRWLLWLTAIVGTLGIIIFAPQLSRLAFGNADYAMWLRIVSVTIITNQLVSGQGAVLTGLQRYKLIANQRMIAGVLGAVISIVLYWTMGINGIVPVILLTSFVNFAVSYIMVRKAKIRAYRIGIVGAIKQGGPMFRMGISIGLSYTLTHLAGFAIRAFIADMSDVATVGLFTASFSLINTYVGLVFSSIESDFYPRLTASCGNRDEYRVTMLNEIELLIFLLTPLIAIMITFAQPVLAIFYSTKFYAARTIIGWTALSMLLRVPGWAMSIGLIARGETKIYFRSQMMFLFYQLGLNMLGFWYGGLTGLGVSYSISQLLYSIQNYLIQRRRGWFVAERGIRMLMLVAVGTGFLLCLLSTFVDSWLQYAVGGLGCAAICYWSLRELNKRLPIISIIKKKILKRSTNS